MFKLLLILPLIALVDPFLFYLLWPHMNFWVRLSFLILYPAAATIYSRSRAAPDGDVVMRVLRWLRHVATWYLGPISKLASLILLIGPVEKSVGAWATTRLQSQIMRGMGGRGPVSERGGTGGMPPGTGSVSGGTPGNIKETRGRVID